jgi:O-acetyl-ADP-ribose deacetylase (regulator of RNase III)
MKPVLVEGDLLDQKVEVIVNPWNRNFIPWWLLWPQGVSGAIKRRAGYQPFRELGRLGIIPLGGAVETSAGRLPFRAIIHVAGLNSFWVSSEKTVRKCVSSALQLAQQQSLSFDCFSADWCGYGRHEPRTGTSAYVRGGCFNPL